MQECIFLQQFYQCTVYTVPTLHKSFWYLSNMQHVVRSKINCQLECWQLTCQFPTWRSPVLCSFDRDNSMYEQQTWMLTLGLPNRNTGSQCCSVSCSPMLKLLCISIHIPNFSLDFPNFEFLTVRRVASVERTASACQISSQTLKPRPRYVNFNIMAVENAYSRPFFSFLGTFPTNDVTHRPNLQKDHPWAEPRHLIAMIGLSCTVTDT